MVTLARDSTCCLVPSETSFEVAASHSVCQRMVFNSCVRNSDICFFLRTKGAGEVSGSRFQRCIWHGSRLFRGLGLIKRQ
ncbi:hypothetical protein BgAZ_103430 [Babesia gibsoni]|uniref:Uncharacterized protein n=1 Tax=Babesia gibsoni TaxID=33632 RepID=A0AAD8PFL4_BABGI|nr:hypothetical protein BgAZ_103430 [Babesia gibsoni]